MNKIKTIKDFKNICKENEVLAEWEALSCLKNNKCAIMYMDKNLFKILERFPSESIEYLSIRGFWKPLPSSTNISYTPGKIFRVKSDIFDKPVKDLE